MFFIKLADVSLLHYNIFRAIETNYINSIALKML